MADIDVGALSEAINDKLDRDGAVHREVKGMAATTS